MIFSKRELEKILFDCQLPCHVSFMKFHAAFSLPNGILIKCDQCDPIGLREKIFFCRQPHHNHHRFSIPLKKCWMNRITTILGYFLYVGWLVNHRFLFVSGSLLSSKAQQIGNTFVWFENSDKQLSWESVQECFKRYDMFILDFYHFLNTFIVFWKPHWYSILV